MRSETNPPGSGQHRVVEERDNRTVPAKGVHNRLRSLAEREQLDLPGCVDEDVVGLLLLNRLLHLEDLEGDHVGRDHLGAVRA